MTNSKNIKLHVKTGDTVKILAGNDKSKTGKVLSVDNNKYRAIVEGINMVTKHIKPSAQNTEGGIQTMESSIHISNLMLVDSKSGEATRIGRKVNENKKLQRFSKKSGDFIA